jgi:hypothetical protein
MAKVAEADTVLYCVFFNTCVEESIDPIYKKAVKYFERINKCTKRGTSVETRIDSYWKQHLEDLPKCTDKKIKIQAGKYAGTSVSIIAYVYGPISKSEIDKSS